MNIERWCWHPVIVFIMGPSTVQDPDIPVPIWIRRPSVKVLSRIGTIRDCRAVHKPGSRAAGSREEFRCPVTSYPFTRPDELSERDFECRPRAHQSVIVSSSQRAISSFDGDRMAKAGDAVYRGNIRGISGMSDELESATGSESTGAGLDLTEQDEWVNCWICEEVFRRRTQTKRYCTVCHRGFCEGWHGNFTVGRGTCVICIAAEAAPAPSL